MTTSIKVTNLQNNLSWTKQITDVELQQIKNQTRDGDKKTFYVISALVIPVRTDTFSNFSKDFFLPTTVNQVQRIKQLVSPVFLVLAYIGAVLLDIISLPLRFITCIPRVLMNGKKEDSLFYKYLKNEGVSAQILESNYVEVELKYVTGGTVFATRNQNTDIYPVNFIELPAYYSRMKFSLHSI